jgi:hypothetical protein
VTITDINIEDLTTATDEGPHIACCVEQERFLCGAPFHPEACLMLEDQDEGVEACEECDAAAMSLPCKSGRRHYHCPLNRRRVCPPVTS